MPKGKRVVSPEDRAIFFQSIQSGMNMKEAARLSGISYTTARNWVATAKKTKLELDEAKLQSGRGTGGNSLSRDLNSMRELPPVIPMEEMRSLFARGHVWSRASPAIRRGGPAIR